MQKDPEPQPQPQQQPSASTTTTPIEPQISLLQTSEKLWQEGNLSASLETLKKFLVKLIEICKLEKDETKRTSMKARIETLMKKFKERKEEMETKQGKKQEKVGVEKEGGVRRQQEGLVNNIEFEVPNIKLSDVFLRKEIIDTLKQRIILPLKFPQIFTGMRYPFHGGILLFGPPGVGKTLLLKAIANQAGVPLIYLNNSDIFSKYGDGQRNLRDVFRFARQHRPCIVCIDEVDAMSYDCVTNETSERLRRIKTEFLVQMQGNYYEGKEQDKNRMPLPVVGITNTPWRVDPAMRRRFEKRIYIRLPEQQQRQNILRRGFQDQKHNISDGKIQEIAARTDGYSGSDLLCLVKDAVFEPVRKLLKAKKFKKIQGKYHMAADSENGPDIREATFQDFSKDEIELPLATEGDFEKAFLSVKASVNKEWVQRFEEWNREFVEY